jgi:Skp family chaperone for outer membrane proteins
MNKNLMALMLALTSMSLSCVAAEVKVCVYDPEIVMSQSKELAGLASEIDKKYQKQFDSLKKEEETLRDEASKLQAKASVMNELARENEQESLVRRKRDLDTRAERVLEDYKRERQKVSMRFLQKLEQGIGEFAQAQSYDLVLPKGPGVYALARADQTSALVTHMNKKFDETKKTLTAAPITVAKK